MEILTSKGSKTELKLGFRLITIFYAVSIIFYTRPWKFSPIYYFGYICAIRKPAVIMVVGVNGGGKTTSLGKWERCLVLSSFIRFET